MKIKWLKIKLRGKRASAEERRGEREVIRQNSVERGERGGRRARRVRREEIGERRKEREWRWNGSAE